MCRLSLCQKSWAFLLCTHFPLLYFYASVVSCRVCIFRERNWHIWDSTGHESLQLRTRRQYFLAWKHLSALIHFFTRVITDICISVPPASAWAAWPKPNYVNPVTRGNENVVVNVVLFSILVCFIALRIFTRTHLRRVFGADDVFILLALVRIPLIPLIYLIAERPGNRSPREFSSS